MLCFIRFRLSTCSVKRREKNSSDLMNSSRSVTEVLAVLPSLGNESKRIFLV